MNRQEACSRPACRSTTERPSCKLKVKGASVLTQVGLRAELGSHKGCPYRLGTKPPKAEHFRKRSYYLLIQ